MTTILLVNLLARAEATGPEKNKVKIFREFIC